VLGWVYLLGICFDGDQCIFEISVGSALNTQINRKLARQKTCSTQPSPPSLLPPSPINQIQPTLVLDPLPNPLNNTHRLLTHRPLPQPLKRLLQLLQRSGPHDQRISKLRFKRTIILHPPIRQVSFRRALLLGYRGPLVESFEEAGLVEAVVVFGAVCFGGVEAAFAGEDVGAGFYEEAACEGRVGVEALWRESVSQSWDSSRFMELFECTYHPQLPQRRKKQLLLLARDSGVIALIHGRQRVSFPLTNLINLLHVVGQKIR
jgi:hypothetical protein